MHGMALVTPELPLPGAGALRASSLAPWGDTLAGLLAGEARAPRVPVTLELDVHLYRPAPAAGVVRGVGRMAKAGRSVFVASVEFTTERGEPVAIGAGSFMAAPDPAARLRGGGDAPQADGRLAVPFAQRAGRERRDPGGAGLPPPEDGRKRANA